MEFISDALASSFLFFPWPSRTRTTVALARLVQK
jgi:hypothetical protein